MQWIGEFSAVQRAELQELEEMKKLIVSMGGNIDTIGKTNEQIMDIVTQVDQKLQKVLEDKSEVRQSCRLSFMMIYLEWDYRFYKTNAQRQ